LRAVVRQHKADGADLIKLLATGSIREGGQQTLSDSQLVAACGEARALGLRTLVHAHSAGSVRAATLAGCTEVEHGLFVTQDVLTLMAARGTYFDPQCALVFRNYLETRAKYQGIGNYTDSGICGDGADAAGCAAGRPHGARHRLKVVMAPMPSLAQTVTAEDLIPARCRGGRTPMHAIAAATSFNAQAMGLATRSADRAGPSRHHRGGW
jgi:imidazolonepropionase-like amidohydrolase